MSQASVGQLHCDCPAQSQLLFFPLPLCQAVSNVSMALAILALPLDCPCWPYRTCSPRCTDDGAPKLALMAQASHQRTKWFPALCGWRSWAMGMSRQSIMSITSIIPQTGSGKQWWMENDIYLLFRPPIRRPGLSVGGFVQIQQYLLFFSFPLIILINHLLLYFFPLSPQAA
jgi:hypothetical protein